MRIVFFGTPEIALPILEALHAQHEIVAVVTAPDAPIGRKQIITETPVAVWSNQKGLNVLKPARVKNNAELIDSLIKLEADIYVVVAYGKILPLEIINIPRLKTVNVHFSLLPKYRGASPIQGALLAGDKITGTSIFILEEGLDTGPILVQQSIAVEEKDDYSTLAGKLASLSAELLIELLPKYDYGIAKPTAQDDSSATYTHIINKDDGKVDWSRAAQEIFNQFRAYKQWPGIWTEWNNKKIKILDCEVSESATNNPSGSVRDDSIACGGGTSLVINTLQIEGGKPQDMKSFLNGHPNFQGATL